MSAPVVSGFTEGTQLPLLPPPRRNVSSLSKLEKGIGPGVDLHQDIQVREINGVILASCDRGEGWYSCRDLSRDCDSRHHETKHTQPSMHTRPPQSNCWVQPQRERSPTAGADLRGRASYRGDNLLTTCAARIIYSQLGCNTRRTACGSSN